MSKTLSGKVALVTGGSRGLGAATAAALADQGADVAINYVASEEKAAAVVEGLKAKGVRAIAIQADQGDPAASGPLIEKVIEDARQARHPGQQRRRRLAGQDHRRSGHRQCSDGPAMDDQHDGRDRQHPRGCQGMPDGGRIISVGSGLGTRIAFPGTTDYAASKAAIVGYSKGAARDLGRRNITVNVVQAGMMDTDMAAGSKDKLPPIILESHAIHRFAQVGEVAAAIVFLAGPDAGFITGSVVDVNGGFTA